jgi:hypothetical protein
MSSTQINHFLFRVGDGSHLWSSSLYNIWGINSSTSGSKYLLEKSKPGDCLWFVKANSCGLIIACAIFERAVKRINGECMPFEALGWTNVPGSWDTDIHFTNFKNIENMNLLSHIKAAANPRVYNSKCLINLPELYSAVYPVEEEPITVKKIMIEGIQYLKAKNGNIYDFETHKFIGTHIDEVFTKEEETVDETDEEESTEENSSNITKQNINISGVDYLVTTNADIKDETTRKFIDSLISSEDSENEDDSEELYEEKNSLRRILLSCKIVSNEINELTSLLNSRLNKLDKLDKLN